MKRILLSALLFAGMANTSNAQLTNLAVGDQAPDFTLTDIHGGTHTLSSYTGAGKVVLIDFFFRNCGPCQSVAPIVNDFHHKYGCNEGDIVVLGFSDRDDDATVQQFEDLYPGNNPYPAGGTDGGGAGIANVYGPSAFPTICLIGADGLVKNIDIWPVSSVADIEAAVSATGITINEQACPSNPNSIEENNISNVNIYPNPASDIANIKFNLIENANNITVEVFDLLGNKVNHENAVNFNATIGENILEAPTANLANGQYFVRISSGNNNIVTQKFTILK